MFFEKYKRPTEIQEYRKSSLWIFHSIRFASLIVHEVSSVLVYLLQKTITRKQLVILRFFYGRGVDLER